MSFRAAIVATLAVLASAITEACQVPVFRYALERWPADHYELVVFRGEHPYSFDHFELGANISMSQMEVGEMSDTDRAIYGDVTLSDDQPLARLFYPRETGFEDPIWEGPPTKENLRRIINSPVRKAIVEKLLSGTSAVWLIFETGDAAKDEKLELQLREQLAAVASEIEIPEGVVGPGNLDRVASGEADMEDVLRSEIPLKIQFDTLRLDPSSPEESIFTALFKPLLTPAREAFPGEPIAVPVFGRGRTIDGIPAPVLDREIVAAACSYICGACSCEVKRENPGIDLLFAVEWDNALEGNSAIAVKSLPPLAGAGDIAGPQPKIVLDEAVDPPPPPDTPDTTEAPKPILVKMWVLIAVLATVLGVATVLIMAKTRP